MPWAIENNGVQFTRYFVPIEDGQANTTVFPVLAQRTPQERLIVSDSVTITDNRTGNSFEVPIVNGGVDSAMWKKNMPGVWFLDPGFTVTASTESAITELDGGQGFLRYRG